jgi:broad specificity phosphatase PhoE
VSAPTGPTTVVHVLRHGEVFNPDKILYGRLPGFHLSDTGRHQADIVAKYLTDADITAVVASPLQRAQETATPSAAVHGLEIVTDERLIEAGNRFEGKKVAVGDGALRDPRNWPLLRDPFTPSWGEPYLQIAHRMFGAVHRARELAEGHEALCVSHQLPIWMLRRFVEGKRLWHDPRRRQCALASLTSLVFTGTQLTGLQYAEPAGASAPTATGA